MLAAAGSDCQASMVMIDPGSDTNFITHDLARRLGVQGQPYQFRLKVVDREARPIQTARYCVEIEDKFGARHQIEAMGSGFHNDACRTTLICPLFNISMDGYPEDVLRRPQGKVDVLLGLRNSSLHGITREQWGELRLMESPLGCGWSLRGTHPCLAVRRSLSVTIACLPQPTPCVVPKTLPKSYKYSTCIGGRTFTSWRS